MEPKYTVHEAASGPFHRPVLNRLISKVIITESCWIWTGNKIVSIWLNGRNAKATRVLWEIYRGPIPDGLFVCHDCPGGDNPNCVNPFHMFLGTHQENLRDASVKGMLSTAKDGERNPGSVLTAEEVMEIRRRHVPGHGGNTRALAIEFGITKNYMSDLIRGARWGHLPYGLALQR